MSYETQEKVFDNITQWLTENNFKLENVRIFSDPTSEVKFYCQAILVEHREEFVKIIIADQTRGSVLLQATVVFDKNEEKAAYCQRCREMANVRSKLENGIYLLESFLTQYLCSSYTLHRSGQRLLPKS